MAAKRIPHACAILLLGIALFGCASPGRLWGDIEAGVESGRYSDATGLLEEQGPGAYGDENGVLYWMDLGLLLHLEGRWSDSNRAFEQAKREAESAYTTSISREAVSLVSTDAIRTYPGENFERAFIHLFAGLNYAMLDASREALVEARQVDALLGSLETRYGERNVYKEDAFARYLTGLLYENAGDRNNARVAYARALDAYASYSRSYGVSVPHSLPATALAAAEAVGSSSREALRRAWPGTAPSRIPEGYGELVILHYNGWAPRKVDELVDVAFADGWGVVRKMQVDGEADERYAQASSVVHAIAASDTVRVAFPKFVEQPHRIARMEVRPNGTGSPVGAELVQDVGKIATKDLQDRIARVRARAVARAVLKYAMQKAAGIAAEHATQGSEYQGLVRLAQIGVSALRTTTERADKRSWRNLPDEIWMARLTLPEGVHDMSLEFLDRDGTLVRGQGLMKVEIVEGQRAFRIVRTTE